MKSAPCLYHTFILCKDWFRLGLAHFISHIALALLMSDIITKLTENMSAPSSQNANSRVEYTFMRVETRE